MTREELIVLIARVMEPDRIEITPGHEDCDICQDSRDYILQRAKDALLAIEASGHVVVPVEPTSHMLDTADGDNVRCGCEECDAAAWEKYRDTWEAMLSVNPLKP